MPASPVVFAEKMGQPALIMTGHIVSLAAKPSGGCEVGLTNGETFSINADYTDLLKKIGFFDQAIAEGQLEE